MKLRIIQGGYKNKKFSHHIDLVDLADELAKKGHTLQAMEKGERGSRIPAINLNLPDGLADETSLELPVSWHLEPYSAQSGLNAIITLPGLREHLADLYGLKHGKELGVRVFLSNYDGERGYLDPNQGSDSDAPENQSSRPRDSVMREIKARRGATVFRDSQLKRYGYKCAISACSSVHVLEAAHIRAYRVEADNSPKNGILLRADLHTLFDLDLIAIEPENDLVSVHRTVKEKQYRQFHGVRVLIPSQGFDATALRERWEIYQERTV